MAAPNAVLGSFQIVVEFFTRAITFKTSDAFPKTGILWLLSIFFYYNINF